MSLQWRLIPKPTLAIFFEVAIKSLNTVTGEVRVCIRFVDYLSSPDYGVLVAIFDVPVYISVDGSLNVPALGLKL